MKRGFTLAEVLITLGIIGVVAALIMPGLIANYQKKTWVTQLQKSVSVWDNGIKLAMAEDDVTEIEETKLFQSVGYGTAWGEDTSAFQKEFSKYFNVVKYVPNYDIFNNNYSQLGFNFTGGMAFADFYSQFEYYHQGLAAYLNDGTKLVLNLRSQCYGPYCGSVVIDVNGDKAPNKLGRDSFVFAVWKSGNLYAFGSQPIDEFNSEMPYWKNGYSNFCGTEGSKDMTGQSGVGCAARIIDNGWVMDY